MSALPNLHDGYFDGLYLSDHRTAHLFLRTVDGQGYSVVLSKVEALHVSNVRPGNIILSFAVNDQIRAEHIQECYDLSDVDHSQQVARLLESAKLKGLLVVEMSPSYGAELTALCAGVDVSIGHSLLQT